MRFPIANVVLWLDLLHFVYPTLARFGSKLPMKFFGWICLTLSASVWLTRLPIANLVLRLDLFHSSRGVHSCPSIEAAVGIGESG